EVPLLYLEYAVALLPATCLHIISFSTQVRSGALFAVCVHGQQESCKRIIRYHRQNSGSAVYRWEWSKKHRQARIHLLFVVTQDISIACVLVGDILDVFAVCHVKITVWALDKGKIICQLCNTPAVGTVNFHIQI